jgi:hypothetical protein
MFRCPGKGGTAYGGAVLTEASWHVCWKDQQGSMIGMSVVKSGSGIQMMVMVELQ